jgi:hypothetical protein
MRLAIEGVPRQAAGASYSPKVQKVRLKDRMFFPALAFLAIRQVARLQALPYPLHDFAGAFLTTTFSFDRVGQHAGTGSSVRALGQFIEG